MANPQKEKGYTAIANEILEKVYGLSELSGLKLRLILVIWRYTYGFNRTEHELSLGFLASAVSSSRSRVSKELTWLIEHKIITRSARSNSYHSQVLKFNKNYDEWAVGLTKSSIDETVNTYCPNGQHPIDETVNRGLTKRSTVDCPNGQPRKKNINTNLNKYIEGVNIYINYIETEYPRPLNEKILSWISYRQLSEEAVKALFDLVDAYRLVHSDSDIANLITECISEQRTVIYWDRLDKKRSEFDLLKNNATMDDLERMTWEALKNDDG